MIYLYFGVIALMRVVQTFSTKISSNLIRTKRQNLLFGGYQNAVSAAFALILLFFTGFYGFDWITFFTAAAMGLVLTLATIINLESLRHSSVILNVTAANAGVFLSAVLGIFLFGEAMTLWHWLGLTAFMSGVLFIGAGSNAAKVKVNLKTVIFLILIFLSNGIVMIIQKYFALKVPDGNITVFSFLAFGVNAVVFCLISLPPPKQIPRPVDAPATKPALKKLVLNGALLSAAVLTINQIVTLCAKTVPSAVLFPVSCSISLIVTAAVGAVAFKEKITPKTAVGLLLALTGIVLSNITL
jgi:drug/metabolite transporter (DMT)-like permease